MRDNLRSGMAPQEAARDARVRLGGLTQLKEDNLERRGLVCRHRIGAGCLPPEYHARSRPPI